MSKILKKLVAVSIGGVALYQVDTHLNARTFQRNLLTAYNGVMIAYEYKVRFKPGSDISAIHQRVAERILHTCQENGGLYVKFGQGVASMNHILPREFAETLKSLFMDAPVIPYSAVAQVIHEDFQGQKPEDIYATFDPVPVASASIAQVHRATLKDGTKVAVKVQKNYIRQQLYWDMKVYRGVMRIFEYLFELPLTWSADYTESHLREEVDFLNEARNAERARSDLKSDSTLSVHIPLVYWDLTTSRVMTCEWIDGIPLYELDKLKAAKFDISDVMTKLIDVLSHQLFISGFVHADPHPGNILIRWDPLKRRKAQICLLDHGLYVKESDSFRLSYCMFWKALFLMDTKTMAEITSSWGIDDVGIFASATLQRPYVADKAVHLSNQLTPTDLYRAQMMNKNRIKKFLSDTEKIPLELIFIGRSLNLIRSNNKGAGSPVNRVNIMAEWAVKGLGNDWRHWTPSSRNYAAKQGVVITKLVDRLAARISLLRFRLTLSLISIGFYFTRLRQRFLQLVYGKSSGFEDILDNQMQNTMKEQFGVEISLESFDA